MFGEAGLSSETSPKRGRALPDIVPMAGGLTPVLSPALFSTQLQPSSKSSEIPNQAVFPLVTLFVLQNKYCRVFLFPHFGIQTVTQFQIRNTLSTAEGSLPAAVFGGGRVFPAYRLYPALFSTHRNFAKMPRQISAVASLSPYGVTALASAENPTQACHGPCRAEILAYPA